MQHDAIVVVSHVDSWLFLSLSWLQKYVRITLNTSSKSENIFLSFSAGTQSHLSMARDWRGWRKVSLPAKHTHTCRDDLPPPRFLYFSRSLSFLPLSNPLQSHVVSPGCATLVRSMGITMLYHPTVTHLAVDTVTLVGVEGGSVLPSTPNWVFK